MIPALSTKNTNFARQKGFGKIDVNYSITNN